MEKQQKSNKTIDRKLKHNILLKVSPQYLMILLIRNEMYMVDKNIRFQPGLKYRLFYFL